MAIVVLDASVVITFLNPADPRHLRAVAALTAHGRQQFILPASVYAEILVGPFRRGPEAFATLDQFVGELGIHIELIGPEIARRAAQLRASIAPLRLPDALALATADVLDATILTGDAAWPKFSRRARLI